MSTTVDNRVVSMQFDNKHFEQNVAVSMSTLDKLKQKLNFSGATKGLDNISAATKNVNMSGLGNSVEAVSAKFSALQVMGVTALANITNSAVNAGKRMVSALTIDPVRTGFNEYELKMNSLQTIMASTGESLATVNRYLEQLNEYSDKTIYSFSDMTQNIGKFTNAGVSLEDAVAAIKGISNEAALSGANTNEASRAMYNFSQALSAGYVKLIDWKSIENANMATKSFKEELIQTALELGTVTQSADGMYQTLDGNAFNATKNFNEVLQDQWMTSEVLITTLKKYSDETTEIGKKATAAATEIKTFTQLFDTLKESAQSGWARTWELIVGDLDEAKALFTGISKVVGGFIDKMSDARNALVEAVMGNPLTKGVRTLLEGIQDPLKAFGSTIDGISESMEGLEQMAQRVIRGDFGNGAERLKIFNEQGWDYARVQNKVNEMLGSSVRHLEQEAEARNQSLNSLVKMTDAQLKALGYTEKEIEALRQVAQYAEKMGVSAEEAAKDLIKESEALNGLTGARNDDIVALMKLTEAELKALGYNDQTIEALKTLAKYSEMTGIPVEKLAEDLSLLDGRTLLLNSFKNIGKGLVQVFESLKQAWQDIFPPKSTEERAAGIYKLVAGFHKLTTQFRLNSETSDKLKRTFKGLFALIDIIYTLTAGPLKIAFEILKEILAMFDLDILDLTAAIGDMLVDVRNWVKENNFLVKGLRFLAPIIKKVVEAIATFIDGINFTRILADIVAHVRVAAEAFSEWLQGLKEAENIPKYIIQGLAKGLKAGISTVWNLAVNLAKTLVDAFKEFLGIHSPSTVMIAMGGFIVAGLLLGIKSSLPEVWNTIKTGVANLLDMLKNSKFGATCSNVASGFVGGVQTIGSGIWGFLKAMWEKIREFIGNVDFGSILIISAIGGIVTSIIMLSNALSGLGRIGAGIGDMLEEFGDAAKTVATGVKNYLNSKALMNFAQAIAVLAMALVVLSYVKPGRLWNAVGAIAALAVVLSALMIVSSKCSKNLTKSRVRVMSQYALMLLELSASVLVLAFAAKMLAQVKWGDLGKTGAAIAALGLVAFLLIKTADTIKSPKRIEVAGQLLAKTALAVVVIALAAKIMGTMAWGEIARAGAVLGGIMIFLGALMFFTRFMSKWNISKDSVIFDNSAQFVTKAATAVLVLALAAKIMGTMAWGEIARAGAVLGGIMVFLGALMFLTRFMSKQKISKYGSVFDDSTRFISKAATSVLLIAVAAKLMGSMSWEAIGKAGTVLAGILVFFGLLMLCSNLMSKSKLSKNGAVFDNSADFVMKAAGAVLMMAFAAKIMSDISWGGVGKAVVLVITFGAVIGALMWFMNTFAKNTSVFNKMETTVLAAAGAILLMALSAKLIDSISWEGVWKALILVSVFGTIIAALMVATDLAGVADMMKTLIGISVAIGVLTLCLALLSMLDPMKLIAPTIALAVVLSALAVVIAQAGKLKKSIGALIVLSVIFTILGATLMLLSTMANPLAVLSSALALTVVLVAMAGVLLVLKSMNLTKTAAEKLSQGVKALMKIMIVVAALAAVLCIMSIAQNVIQNAIVLTLMSAALVGLIYLLKPLGTSAGVAIKAVGLLAAITVPLLLLAAALSVMSNVQNAVTNALVLGGLVIAMAVVLVMLGELQMTIKQALVGVVGMIGLAVMLNIMTKAMQGVSGVSWGDIAKGLVILAGAFVILGVAGYALSGAVLPILGLAAVLVLVGLSVVLAGAGLQMLATGFTMLAATLSTNTTVILDNLNLLVTGLFAIFAAFIAGTGNAIITLCNMIVAAAPAIYQAVLTMAAVILNVGIVLVPKIVEFAITLVSAFIDAIMTLVPKYVELAVTIITAFCQGLQQTAPVIIQTVVLIVSQLLLALNTLIPQFVQLAVTAITSMLAAIKALVPVFIETGLSILMAFLTGIRNGVYMVAIMAGEIIVAFLDGLGQAWCRVIDAAFNLIITFIEGLAAAIDGNKQGLYNAIEKLVMAIVNLVVGFHTMFSDIGRKIIGVIAGGMGKAEGEAKSIMGTILSGIGKKISDSFSTFMSFGKKLINKLKSGIESGKEFVKSAMGKVITALKEGALSKWEALKSAGKELINGFKEGITSKIQDIKDAAAGVCKGAVDTVKSWLGINSPSKVFIGIGRWTDEGFAVGLKKYAGRVNNSAAAVGDGAVNAMTRSLSSISDMVSSDIDAQPTIRPVLDLTDVETKAGRIGGLLGGQTLSVGARSAGVISSMMNLRGQNGSNDDVVSALDKLGERLGNVRGDTYQINGVTYDDGSNISAFAQAIVRQARIERRA